MKLADCPPEMIAALGQVRYGPRGLPPMHPADGHAWFQEPWLCAMCGGKDSRATCEDHCHVTGLYRGRLCTACNLAEGRDAGGEWYWWRRLAPGLANREIADGKRSPNLTDEEVLTLPIDTLFALHRERETVRLRPARASLAAALLRGAS